MNSRRILITSPSLNIKDNVSGISSLVSDIISHSKLNFVHFQLGSSDGKRRNLHWVIGLIRNYLKIISLSIFNRYEFVHLNLGLERPSIIRDSLVFFIVNKIFRKKVILHIHGGYYLMHHIQSRLLNFLLKKDFKNAQAIIVLSELEKEILSKRYGNLSFIVFPNSVDTGIANSLSTRSLDDTIRFVFMGRIVKAKGISIISESLEYLTDYFKHFSLDIYGAGEDIEEWLSALSRYPELKFSYKGVVGGKDKWNALNSSDVLLLPSVSGEGMPIVMIEAMAVGCVVIVTDIASVKTVITDNLNGILLTESCPRQLAMRIKNVIDGKIDLKTVGENAKEYVQTNLSLSNYINKLEQLYSTI